MSEITPAEIGNVMNSILARSRAELLALSEDQLESRWHFTYEPDQSAAWNMYRFSEALEMYKRLCRDWEAHHNGNSCVVERVRDKYLMPKINEFLSLSPYRNEG
jgi:hypothetical protein